ncbi:MAG TPA: DNA repair protein RadC [Candidatus Woesebacteria bacterium]|nr:DNA repair protein RadC [Candidatus Woesebacteria bacterium]
MLKKQPIKNLAKRYRPREKAEKYGLKALSNYELLALIIGSGHKNCNALELAKKVEKHLLAPNAITQNQTKEEQKLLQIPGIGAVLASKILASLELGQRLAQKSDTKQINQPSKIFELSTELGNKKQEYCLAFYLNGRQELLSKKTLAIGGLNYNFMEPRDIFGPAFTLGASSFILVHNHPSGDPRPSDDDLILTEKIAKLADLMGIKLLDHLIVCKNSYFSIKEHFGELLDV